jgi:hypothetical protein
MIYLRGWNKKNRSKFYLANVESKNFDKLITGQVIYFFISDSRFVKTIVVVAFGKYHVMPTYLFDN